jgi:hypothetical protein
MERDAPGEVVPAAASRDGRLDRVERELGAEVVGDRPAEKTTRAGVDGERDSVVIEGVGDLQRGLGVLGPRVWI